MSLQARMSSNDGRLYNPSRDVAHHFADVAKMVAERIEKPGQWPALERHLEEHDLTDEELGLACKAFVEWVATAAKHPEEKMHQALQRCGWEKADEDGVFAVMAVLGSIMMGIYWVGVREATLGEDGPGVTAQALVKDANDIAKVMTVPRWRRKWHRRISRFKDAWNASRQKEG